MLQSNLSQYVILHCSFVLIRAILISKISFATSSQHTHGEDVSNLRMVVVAIMGGNTPIVKSLEKTLIKFS